MLPLELLILSAATVSARGDKLKLFQNSSRIQYQSSQRSGASTSQDGANIFALFWGGNGLSIYGSISGSEKDISITLDNQTQTLDFSSQLPSGGLIWSRTGLAEGDHLLLVSHCGNGSLPESTLSLEYILLEREAENDTAPQFEPARIGTTPKSVPSSAYLLDDTSPLITTRGEWIKSTGAPLGSYWYNSTALSTSSANSSLIFSFSGTAVWCYGTRYLSGGSVEVKIDGEQIDSFDAAGYEQQYPLWSRQNLEPCNHTLVITTKNCPVPPCASYAGQTCSSCFDPCLSIDFFRFLDQGFLWTDSPGPGFPGPGPDSNPLSVTIAGIVGGVFIILITVILFLAWRVLFIQPATYKNAADH